MIGGGGPAFDYDCDYEDDEGGHGVSKDAEQAFERLVMPPRIPLHSGWTEEREAERLRTREIEALVSKLATPANQAMVKRQYYDLVDAYAATGSTETLSEMESAVHAMTDATYAEVRAKPLVSFREPAKRKPAWKQYIPVSIAAVCLISYMIWLILAVN